MILRLILFMMLIQRLYVILIRLFIIVIRLFMIVIRRYPELKLIFSSCFFFFFSVCL